MSFFSLKGKKKEILVSDTAIISISLHNPNLNGIKLGYIVDWVNRQENFKKCYIDLSDTLYRHNYLLTDTSITLNGAYLRSLENGEKWIHNQTHILNKLRMPYTILRWDSWLKHELYEKYYKIYQANYQKYQPLKLTIDNDINTFYSRKGISNNCLLPKEKIHSLNFLLEELACHTIMYEAITGVKIYPGRMSSCFKFVKDNGVPNIKEPFKGMIYARLIYHGDENEEKSDLLRDIKAA